MRGVPLAPSLRKLDAVLVAARYSPHDGTITQVRAYERRGAVWSDWLVLDRASLMKRLDAGKRVVTGIPRDLPGEFQVLLPVRRQRRDGGTWIVAGEHAEAPRDDLGLPAF